MPGNALYLLPFMPGARVEPGVFQDRSIQPLWHPSVRAALSQLLEMAANTPMLVGGARSVE
jgi:hypothetical protein